jgi:hypothetical protein
MPQHHITQAEAYILSFFDNGKFEAEHRQLHHDFTMPKVTRAIRDEYGYDDGINFFEYVIDRVERRHLMAKERRNRSELGAYLCFLKKAQRLLELLQENHETEMSKPSFMRSMINIYRGNADQGVLRP